MSGKSFIHKFKDGKNRNIIYCANTNRIMQVNDDIYSAIDYFGYNSQYLKRKFNSNFERIYNAIAEINELNKINGFAGQTFPESSVIKTGQDEYHYKLNNEMKSITLNVTNECNLSCKYCLFGEYFYNRRNDNCRMMSMEVAENALKLLFHNSKNAERLHIGFYGGEPLLNYNLIKYIVNQAKGMNRQAKRINFHMTTNGTLLDNEKIRWLIENNISLLISLDGPRNIHDRYRRFKNGKGSHDLIIENISRILDMNCDYYKNHIHFTAVMAPPVSYLTLVNYFLNNEIFDMRYRINGLHMDDKGYFLALHNGKKVSNIFKKVIGANLDMLQNNKLDPKGEKELNDVISMMDLKRIVERNIFTSCEKVVQLPICEIGISRCFIAGDGRIYPCERIRQSNHLAVGDVKYGFYKCEKYGSKAYRIMDELFELIKGHCVKCWAYKFCSQRTCFNIGLNRNRLSRRFMHESCVKIRNRIERAMSLYINYENKYPGVLKMFVNRTGQEQLIMK